MLGLPDVAIGAFSGALITGLVTLLALIISKEQKISEFRQAWIDALRTEVSLLIAHANSIANARSALNKSSSEAWGASQSDFIALNQATAEIRMRLNSNEQEAGAILSKILEIEYLFMSKSSVEVGKLNKLEKELVELVRILLKSEWRRVQRGEPVYQFTKNIVVFILGMSVLVLAELICPWMAAS
jgi:hypothetical protein